MMNEELRQRANQFKQSICIGVVVFASPSPEGVCNYFVVLAVENYLGHASVMLCMNELRVVVVILEVDTTETDLQ